jgi:uncharacterized pyridoxal phosphate-containing UPF0001 family protein
LRSIELIAVSKTFPAAAVVEAIAAGQLAFGESYAQEWVDKRAQVESQLRARAGAEAVVSNLSGSASGAAIPPARWHFIGPVQSNKTRLIAGHFDWVHSIDRLKIAQRLSEARPPNAPDLQVCIQVNVSGEATKSGIAPEGVHALALQVLPLPRLRLRGLMAIPRATPDQREQRAQFRMLRELRDQLAALGVMLDTLSMGMSDDLEAAIAEGATLVRVGRAIFGERSLA